MKGNLLLKCISSTLVIILLATPALTGCRAAPATSEQVLETDEEEKSPSTDELKERAYQTAREAIIERDPEFKLSGEYSPDKVIEEAPGIFEITLSDSTGNIWHCVVQYYEDGDMFDALEIVKEGEEIATQQETGQVNIKGGMLAQNETWSGDIIVNNGIIVPEGVTLTIEPGTRVMFKHYRGYKEPEKRLGLEVNGGTLLALGKPDNQIWFTSDSEEPINGDWWEIFLRNTNTSKLDYVIVEFSQMGISQFDSEVPITNSIVRWTNSESLYAERSSPAFENNTLYENGYHEIALEHYNRDVVIRNNIFRNGRVAIHTQETTSLIENNYFTGYDNEVISITADSESIVKNNRFEDIGNKESAIITESESTATVEGNDFGQGNFEIPVFDYQDIKDHGLGYIPGDPEVLLMRPKYLRAAAKH